MGGGASKQKKKKKDLTTDTVTSHDGGESRPKPPPYTNGSGATHTATNEGCSLVCPECCAVNSESVNFCGECGQQIGQPQPNAESIATDIVVNVRGCLSMCLCPLLSLSLPLLPLPPAK
jgi:hypothetical protein